MLCSDVFFVFSPSSSLSTRNKHPLFCFEEKLHSALLDFMVSKLIDCIVKYLFFYLEAIAQGNPTVLAIAEYPKIELINKYIFEY